MKDRVFEIVLSVLITLVGFILVLMWSTISADHDTLILLESKVEQITTDVDTDIKQDNQLSKQWKILNNIETGLNNIIFHYNEQRVDTMERMPLYFRPPHLLADQ